jgi:hypothetical protein
MAQLGEVSRVGGWRGSPNSIAALLRCQVSYADQRKCKRCRNMALRGRDQCRRHAGIRVASDVGGRAESRMLGRLERLGLLPLELLAWPLWQDLATVRLAERAPVRLALVQAWDKRDQAPLYWSRVQRQAIGVARQAPRVKGVAGPWCAHA